jgi:hypothetical protein
MLNQTEVLQYVKDNLGFPFMHLELEDEKIIDYFSTHTTETFGYYIPQRWKTPLNLELDSNKVPGIGNEWYITEPQGLEILNVIDFYTNTGELYLHGHPPLGPLSHGELREWAYQVETAMQTKMFSSFDYTMEFKHPNVIRISPLPSGTLGTVIIEYERQQPHDLSGIPNDQKHLFKDLALADIMLVIGRIRKRYGGGNLRTPFGEVPLESDIYEEGKELKREIIEKMERLFIPNVRIDHG